MQPETPPGRKAIDMTEFLPRPTGDHLNDREQLDRLRMNESIPITTHTTISPIIVFGVSAVALVLGIVVGSHFGTFLIVLGVLGIIGGFVVKRINNRPVFSTQRVVARPLTDDPHRRPRQR